MDKNGKKFCFFTLADDSAQIDAICFSEVLESLNFDLKKGKIYNFKISVQFKDNNRRFIVNNIKDLYGRKGPSENYLVKLDAGKLNLDKVSNLFKNCEEGYSDLSFLVEINNYEIVIESKKKFELDFNFLNKASSIKGMLINKDYNNS